MKKYLITGSLIVAVLAFRNITADDKRSAAVNIAIDKSLVLLQKTSHEFLENAATCHSCHNQGLGVVTFAMAKDNGFEVNDTIIREAIDSTCNYWKPPANRQTLAENDDPVAIVMTGSYDLWGLSASHYKSDKLIELISRNIMRKQGYDGSWVSPGQRPPLEYYSFTATALAVKNIQSYMPAILKPEVEQRINKARLWLMQNKPEANEEKVFQVLGLLWSAADKKITVQQADKLLAAQHADGGWSQLDSLPTDAYATGQSLYALNQSGRLAVTAPAYQKGIDFLLNIQQSDGSWHVITRSYPFVPYVSSGFPHNKDQFISAAGSNWATMALILSAKKN
ncbi:MAG: prenyltransferase/squalene oxidase repeat-containing protein [Chitinophagaceae bacterium]